MPENTSVKTRRIAKNTVLLYLRSLISLLISLYTSRFVLKALGVDDYGIYGVVGGFVSMFTIVTGSLSGAISRFLNFAMGRGEKEELANTFSMSLNIMAILSIIVLVLTETFGLWFLYNKMNIPPDRVPAAFWCFQFSVLSTISGFLTVSFTGAIIAHEKMGVFAYIDVGETVLKFLIAVFLTLSLGRIDKLIIYAALLLSINLSKQMFSRIYAMRHFEECRLRWFWDKKTFLDLFGYAGWSFLGKASGTFSGQGVNMVVNVVFGPAVNAARSLSWTVIHAVGIFVNNFTMAINPQVTQSYAAGDRAYMDSLLFRGTKFTYYIMWMVVLPLVLETEFVVGLWLGEYPDHTINFIRLALIYNLIGTLQAVLLMGIRATGNIKWLQITFSSLEFLTFGLAYVLLHHGFAPEWSYLCSMISMILKVLVMWLLCRIQLSLPIRDFIATVLLPISIVTLVSTSIPLLVRMLMPDGWLRFLIVLAVSLGSASVSILFLGCSQPERKMLMDMVLGKIRKLRG